MSLVCQQIRYYSKYKYKLEFLFWQLWYEQVGVIKKIKRLIDFFVWRSEFYFMNRGIQNNFRYYILLLPFSQSLTNLTILYEYIICYIADMQ